MGSDRVLGWVLVGLLSALGLGFVLGLARPRTPLAAAGAAAGRPDRRFDARAEADGADAATDADARADRA